MTTKTVGEVTPYNPSESSTIAKELASLDRASLAARLGTGALYQEEEPTVTRSVGRPRHGSLYWQTPCPCWIFLSDEDAAQFELSSEKIWRSEEERQASLIRDLTIDQLDVPEKDEAAFTKGFQQNEEAFYQEYLKLATVQLGLHAAADKATQVLSLLLDDPSFSLHDLQIKTTMRDLVDLKFTELMVDRLNLKDKDGVLDRRMAALAQFLPRGSENAKLSELFSLLQMQRPTEAK